MGRGKAPPPPFFISFISSECTYFFSSISSKSTHFFWMHLFSPVRSALKVQLLPFFQLWKHPLSQFDQLRKPSSFWPCRKICQGHPRVVIYINFVELLYLMLRAKFQNHRPSGYGECHVTWTIYTNFNSPFLRMLHMKFGFDSHSRFRGDVWT